ncbi:MAG: hypothetical protein Q4D90_08015, partial [bacterium]|nr:hypothetical protein [bacterium]
YCLLKLVEDLRQEGYVFSIAIDEKLAHVMAGQTFRALYEMVAQNIPKNQAFDYMISVYRMQYMGWNERIGVVGETGNRHM